VVGKAAQKHAPGISAKYLTYLLLYDCSGELGGETSSSAYEVDGVAYEFRGNRVVTGLGEGWE